MLMEMEPNLSLVIDLTNTTRYYDKEVSITIIAILFDHTLPEYILLTFNHRSFIRKCYRNIVNQKPQLLFY